MLSYYLLMIESEEDKQKFERLYDQYNDLMFYIAKRYFTEQQDLEDVVQDAYLAIVKNIEKIEDVYSSKTRHFIVTVIENKSLDVLKKRKGIIQIEWEETTPGLEADAPVENMLSSALIKLPATYREILMLKYYNGYTIREIAEILSVHPKAAESTLWRAKKALQDLLEKEGMMI